MARYHLAMMQKEQQQYLAASSNLEAFRNVLEVHKLSEMKKYRDFFTQAALELEQLKKR